jgi:flagellar basal body-associated protein FliL
MAEETKKKPDGAAGAGGHDKGAEKKEGTKAAGGGGGVGGLVTKTPVLMGGVMLIEAVVLFAGFKFLGGGGPRSAAGAELVSEDPSASGEHAAEGAGTKEGEPGNKGAAIDKRKSVEVQILDFRAPNKQSGRTFLYDVTISAVTKAEYKDRVEATIKEREALIKDRVRTIIAQLDPEKLGGASEPGLETLRRQVKYQLDEIIGEGMIDEVLVPRCIPFRTDY